MAVSLSFYMFMTFFITCLLKTAFLNRVFRLGNCLQLQISCGSMTPDKKVRCERELLIATGLKTTQQDSIFSTNNGFVKFSNPFFFFNVEGRLVWRRASSISHTG